MAEERIRGADSGCKFCIGLVALPAAGFDAVDGS